MSTPDRYAQAAVQPDAPALSAASTALVTVAGGGRPKPVPADPPVNAHRLFYGLGYLGLALVWTGMWLEASGGGGSDAAGIIGMLFTGVGGFGAFIHTVYRPNARKVRHLLLAVGSLALVVASYPLVQSVSREIYANGAVVRLQPLAEALARDARIRQIGGGEGEAYLNGFSGPSRGTGRMRGGVYGQTLDDVLTRDRIRRDEFTAYQRWLGRVGMQRAERTPSAVAFYPDGPAGPWLVYVLPGHPLPPAREMVYGVASGPAYRSRPLGGAWYMVLSP